MQNSLTDIPFMPQWKEKMLSGQKVCTTRNKKYGEAGERFNQFGSSFEITKVVRLTLEDVTYRYYNDEGCESPEEFIRIWLRLHPIMTWMPGHKVYAHFFRRVE